MILGLNINSTREELDRVDEDLSYIINVARRNIKSPNRIVPFSMKKLRNRIKVMFWKVI